MIISRHVQSFHQNMKHISSAETYNDNVQSPFSILFERSSASWNLHTAEGKTKVNDANEFFFQTDFTAY